MGKKERLFLPELGPQITCHVFSRLFFNWNTAFLYRRSGLSRGSGTATAWAMGSICQTGGSSLQYFSTSEQVKESNWTSGLVQINLAYLGKWFHIIIQEPSILIVVMQRQICVLWWNKATIKKLILPIYSQRTWLGKHSWRRPWTGPWRWLGLWQAAAGKGEEVLVV